MPKGIYNRGRRRRGRPRKVDCLTATSAVDVSMSRLNQAIVALRKHILSAAIEIESMVGGNE